DVAAGAAEADHRVLLVRLVAAAADEVGVLVGLEVAQAHDHRVRRDRGGDGRDAFGKTVDVEIHRVAVAGDALVDLLLRRRVLLVVLQQGLGVHADVAGDDHLQPRQAYTGVGQHREVERTLRVGNVHHHLERCRRHVLQVGGVALEGQGAVVDETGVAFGAADGDHLAVLDRIQRVAGADHGRYAQLARDDRGMAGATTTVGDDGGRALHHRLPVRVGHVGDEHVAGLHARHVVKRAHHPGDAAADLLADRAALADHRATLAELVTLDLGRLGARLDRLGARLDDEELAADAVLGPLDVHRTLVVL